MKTNMSTREKAEAFDSIVNRCSNAADLIQESGTHFIAYFDSGTAEEYAKKTRDRRVEAIGETILDYEKAIETAFECFDRLKSLGVDSAPWIHHFIKSEEYSKYGNYCSPGPKLRLEVR